MFGSLRKRVNFSVSGDSLSLRWRWTKQRSIALIVLILAVSLLVALMFWGRGLAELLGLTSYDTIRSVTPTTFAPEADAYVDPSKPNRNYGNRSDLLIDGQTGAGALHESYLRFTVTNVADPVESAKLRIYAFDGSDNGPAVYATDNNWTENGITWNNRPKRTSEAIAEVSSVSSNSWIEYDVTPLVSGNGTYSFVLAPVSSDGVDTYSREGKYAPQLVLTLTNQPIREHVAATVETDPVPNTGDAADDPAIWVHPTDPSQSTIIGADKQGGVAVYDLSGKELQYLPDGRMNNVDIRAGFPLGDESVALVTASNASTNSIAIYRVNVATRQLENVAAREIKTIEAYGSCMYHSASTDTFYYFVNNKSGDVEQWELFDNGSGKVDARNVRTFSVGGRTEGCVADDELGHLYIGEESFGIWKYGAEPDAGAGRTIIDTTALGGGGNLTIDVEGLAIAYGANGTGYLIASSQGDNSFAVYDRQGANRYLKSFKIISSNGIDDVKQTDGIDVTTANLGPNFPEGVLVVQDGFNDVGNQNFKLVPWESIYQP